MYTKIEELEGKILKSVKVGKYEDGDAIYFELATGETYVMYHEQDCCEGVWLEDICGDLDDLVGNELIRAEERFEDTSSDSEWDGISGWTFYEFATIKGSVTLKWGGESNGYYGIGVSVVRYS